MRLQEDDVAEADVAAWLRWCAADTANLEAFERVQRLYDQLQALSPSDRKAFLRLRPVAPERSAAPRMFRRVLSWGREHARPLVAAVAVAAIATALLVTGLSDRSPLIESRSYQASKGAQETLLLADRSQVTLASASELSSRFTPTTRFVDLRQGEAFFEVQHEQSRPFVVRAGAMTVTAVGTKFNVRTSGARTVVAVTEGAVDVTADETTHNRLASARSGNAAAETITSPVRLRAGQQAVLQSDQRGLMVIDVSTAAATGWQQGRLEYVMEPLSSVVDNVNRYASRHMVIEDASLGAMVFTGTVFVDRVDEWAMTLPAAFPVATSVAADGTLTLKLRSGGRRSDFR